MADLLEILIGADLKDNSITDIKSKIDKLIKDYNNKEISLKLDANEVDDIVNISQALSNLNTQMKSMTKQQKQTLNNQKKATKEVLDTSKKLNQEQLDAINQQRKAYGDLDKIQTSLNAKGEKILKITRKQNDYVKQTAKIQNGKVTPTTEIDQGGFNKKKRGLEGQAKQLKETGMLSDADLKKFEDSFKGLTVDSKDLNKSLERADQIFKNLNNKSKALSQVDKEMIKARDALSKYTDEEIADNQQLARIKAQIKNMDNFRTLESNKDVSVDNIKYLQLQERRTNQLKTAVKELTDAEKARVKTTEGLDKRKGGLQNKVQGLKDTGMLSDKEIKDFEKSFQGLTVDSKNLNESLDRADKIFQNLNNKSKALSKVEKDTLKARQILSQYTDEEIKNNQHLARIKNQIKQMDNFQRIERRGDIGKDNIKYLEMQQRKTQALKDAVEQLAQAEKARVANIKRGTQMDMKDAEGQRLQGRLGEIGRMDTSNVQGVRQQREAMKEWVAETMRVKHGLAGVTAEMVQLKPVVDGNGKTMYRVITSYQRGNNQLQEYIHTLDLAGRRMDYFNDNVRRTGQGPLQILGNAMRRIPIYMGAMGMFYGAINQVTQGVQGIYEIDKAMTNLQKVTEATEGQLLQFKDTANEIGQTLGALTKDVIQATTEFQKLGYTLDESSNLAQQSIIYANVGDMGVDEASKTLLASLRGFGVGQEQVISESRKYVDIFNEVGNNYAITSAGIGQALQRSSAILNVAGNSVEESVALITSANATVQDPKKVGNALKTIAMRLQGVSEDGSEVLDVMPTLRKMFKEIGIEIMSQEGEMLNTYEIFDKLAERWNTGELDQLTKANFAEQLGGKHQGAVVSAMLENWDDAQGALQSAQTSMGSANREFEKYQDSMEYRVNQLKNSMEEFWMAFWNEEAMKDVLDGLNNLIQSLTWMVENVGTLTPIVSTAFAMLLLFNKEMRMAFAVQRGTGVIGHFDAVSRGASVATTKVKAFAMALRSAFLPLLAVTAVIFLIEKLTQAFMKAKNERDDYIKTLKDSIVETEKFLNDMEDFSLQEYKDLEAGARTGSLNNEEYERFSYLQENIIQRYPELIAGYDDEGKAIIRSGDSLERYIELQERRLHNDAVALQQTLLEDNNDGETDTFGAWINPFDTDFEKIEKQLKEIEDYKDEIKETNKTTNDLTLNFDNLLSDEGIQKFKQNKNEAITEAQGLMQELSMLQLEGPNADKFASTRVLFASNLYQGNFDEAKKYYEQIQVLFEDNRKAMGIELSKLEGDLSTSSEAFTEYLGATYDAIRTSDTVTGDDIPLLNEINIAVSDNFQELEGTLVERADSVETLFDKIREVAEDQDIDVGKMFEVDNANDTIDFLEGLLKNMDLNENEAKVLTEVLQKLRATATSQEEKGFDLNMWRQDTYDHWGEALDEMDALDKAYTDITEGQGLTLKGMQALIKEHPELAKHMEVQGDMLSFNAEGVKSLQKIRADAHKEQLQTDKEALESAIKKAQAELGGMLKVGKGLQELSKLRQKDLNMIKSQRADEYVSELDRLGVLPNGAKNLEEAREMYMGYINNKFAPLESMTAELNALEKIMNSVGGAYSNPISSFPSQDKQKEEKVEIYISNKYREALLKLNKELAEQQRIKASHGKFSKEYQKSLEREIEILKQKVQWTEAEKKSVQEQLRTGRYITYGTVDAKEAVKPTGGTTPNIDPYNYTSGASSVKGGYTGQYATEINRYASQYGLDPWLIASVIKQESSFNRTATSPAGARGLMQLMPATGNSLGVYGNEFWDASKNIEAGTRYLAQQIKSFGSVQLGLAAYNAGPGNVRKYGGIPPFKETQNYVSRIMANYGGGGGVTSYGGGGGGGGYGTVRYGARGNAVREIQRAVGVAVDGIFGPKTLSAVKKFQQQMGLAVDGIVGQNTWAKIKGGATTTSGGGGGGGYTGSTPTTRYGARGEHVKAIQRVVGVAVDGIFGPKTLSAVKKFQQQMGIAVDGIVGSQTWAKIKGQGGGGGATGGGGGGYTGPTPLTRYGARGEHVKAIQRVVGVAVDGIFGPKTLDAVKKFQKQMGIAVDGIVGPNTWAKIKGQSGGGTGGGGSTGTNVKSEAEQQLLDLELELTQQSNDLQSQIRDLMVALIGNSIAKVVADSDALADELARADWEAERAVTTAEKSQFLEQGLNFIRQQQSLNKTAIDTLWKEYNKRSKEMNEETRYEALAMIQEQEMRRIDLEREAFNRAKSIIDNQMEALDTDINSRYNDLETFIEDIERRLNTIDVTENPKEYLRLLKEQRTAQNEQRLILGDHIDKLEKMKDQFKGQSEVIDYIDEKIKELTGDYKDLGDEIYDTNKQIEDAFKDFADKNIELYKETLEKRRQGEIETIDEIMEKERELHDKKMEQWDEELKAIDELYGTELENIDKAESQRSYQNQLEEMQTDRQKVVDQLSLYAIDTTVEGRANRRRLEEELADIDKQIEEHRHQREIELTREAIREEQEEQRKNIEQQRENASKELEISQETKEEQKEEIDKHYEEMLNDEEYIEGLREQMIDGHFDEINRIFEESVGTMGQFSEELGTNLTKNFIDKLKEANAEMAIFGAEATKIQSPFEIGVGLGPNDTALQTEIAELQVRLHKAKALQDSVIESRGAGSDLAQSVSRMRTALENQLNNISVNFNIDRIENGVETANILYKQFIENMKRKGVIV